MVVFSGVVLDKESRESLKELFKLGFPKMVHDKWTIHCHHMTICLGELEDKSLINKEVSLEIISIGKSDLAVAVGVKGFDGKINNKIPHITLAVNQTNGGKPQHSNDIKEWFNYFPDIKLKGVIKEVSYNKK